MLLVKWGSLLPNLLGLIVELSFFPLFIYHMRRHKRPVIEILLSLSSGFIYSIIVCIHSLEITSSDNSQYILRGCYLIALTFHMVFFYKFLEKIRSLQPSEFHFMVIMCFSLLTIFGLITLMSFYNNFPKESLIFIRLTLITRIGLNGLGIYVFGIFGIPVCYKMWKYTSEKLTNLFYFSIIFSTLGYMITFIISIPETYNPLPNYLEIIKIIGDTIPFIGVTLFFLICAFNLNYIILPPMNNTIMVVTHRNSGLNLLSLTFESENRRNNKNDQFFSILNSAIDLLHLSTSNPNTNLSNDLSDDMSLILETGEFITVTIATNQTSYMLQKGLDIFIRKFETMFKDHLINLPSSNEIFYSGIKTFERIFPFLKLLDKRE